MSAPIKIFLAAVAEWGDGDLTGIAIAEDGTVLGNHISSNEAWLEHDLRAKTEAFERHARAGYELEFIGVGKAKDHAGLRLALERQLALCADTDDPSKTG